MEICFISTTHNVNVENSLTTINSVQEKIPDKSSFHIGISESLHFSEDVKWFSLQC